MATGGIDAAAPASGRAVREIGRGGAMREAWIALRNRLLTSARFQRLAVRFPLSRPFARSRAQAAFDLCAGFVYAQILQAMLRLDLLARLQAGPASVDTLAGEHGIAPERLRRLLWAAAALDLTEPLANERFALGGTGAALLANPAATAMVAHHDQLYADLEDPVALVASQQGDTRLGAFWPYAGAADPSRIGESATRAYSALMSASHMLAADDLFAAYGLDRHRHLLDIGGGEAAFAVAAARRYPHLRCTSFDLPGVAHRARTRVTEAGLDGRVAVAEGDFFRDPLPAGADVATLLRILHDHDDSQALALLRAVRKALASDGRLVIAEPMSPERGAGRIPDAYFGMYLLAMGSGRPRSAGEIAALLRAAGFRPLGRGARRGWMSAVMTAVPVAKGADSKPVSRSADSHSRGVYNA